MAPPVEPERDPEHLPDASSDSEPDTPTPTLQHPRVPRAKGKGVPRPKEPTQSTSSRATGPRAPSIEDASGSDSEAHAPENFSASTDRLTTRTDAIPKLKLKRGPPEFSTPQRPIAKHSRLQEPSPAIPTAELGASQPAYSGHTLPELS